MDERRLTVFRAVARELSFSRAADELHLSQSAVSQRIAALETELGGPLFERTRRRVRLTPAGVALLARVDALLGEIAAARRAVAGARGAVAGELRIAASRTISGYVLPAALATLAGRHEDLSLRVAVQNTEQVMRGLLAGTADVGFIEGDVDREQVELRAFGRDELVVAVAAGHRLARLEEVPAAELVREPLVLREPGSGTRQVTARHLRGLGATPGALRVAAELSDIEAIKSLVSAGFGATILSRAALDLELRLGTLVARPLAGGPIRRALAAATVRGGTLLPAVAELLELLRGGVSRPTWMPAQRGPP